MTARLFLFSTLLWVPLWSLADIRPVAQPIPDVVVESSGMSLPQSQMAVIQSGDRYQGLVNLHTREELQDILQRADRAAQASGYQADKPVALILHGDEIALFLRGRYRDNKALVDMAARLDAFNVVDVKVCERWMAEHDVSRDELPPFLETVPDGPAEVLRLQGEGYASF